MHVLTLTSDFWHIYIRMAHIAAVITITTTAKCLAGAFVVLPKLFINCIRQYSLKRALNVAIKKHAPTSGSNK